MPEAMTILLFNDSLQVETLGDACLISILLTINVASFVRYDSQKN